jgi:hypothetical protein
MSRLTSPITENFDFFPYPGVDLIIALPCLAFFDFLLALHARLLDPLAWD